MKAKRFLAGLLTTAMVLTSLPMAAFAAEGAVAEGERGSAKVSSGMLEMTPAEAESYLADGADTIKDIEFQIEINSVTTETTRAEFVLTFENVEPTFETLGRCGTVNGEDFLVFFAEQNEYGFVVEAYNNSGFKAGDVVKINLDNFKLKMLEPADVLVSFDSDFGFFGYYIIVDVMDEEPDTGEGEEPDTGEGEEPDTGEGEEPDTGEGEEPGTGEPGDIIINEETGAAELITGTTTPDDTGKVTATVDAVWAADAMDAVKDPDGGVNTLVLNAKTDTGAATATEVAVPGTIIDELAGIGQAEMEIRTDTAVVAVNNSVLNVLGASGSEYELVLQVEPTANEEALSNAISIGFVQRVSGDEKPVAINHPDHQIKLFTTFDMPAGRTNSNGLTVKYFDSIRNVRGTADSVKLIDNVSVVEASWTVNHLTDFYLADKPVSYGGGGGGGSTGYVISADKDMENGSVSVKGSAEKGSTVTVAVKPDEGYELDKLTVTDKDGNVIEVTDKGDGTFTFKMPAGKVEIDATFKEVTETPVNPAEEEGAIVLTVGSTAATVDGKAVVNDVAPVIKGDRTMLPIRFIAEALGATVTWNGETDTVTITKDGMEIQIIIGATSAIVNGVAVELDAPAFIENDRTYLPLRFVAENLGADVYWDADAKQVVIIPNK